MLGLAAVTGVVATANTPASAVGIPRNGLTEATAAPSCWSIKQNYPASADGLYWLWTPKLVQPNQYYCDMTTEGGGWVLIGRGRDGWTFPYWGQGSPSTVRTNVTGTAAFAPATLSTPVVDGLMNGGRMDALTDGLRLRRATNIAGTTWQEVRMVVRSFGTWSWAMGGGIPLSSVKFDNTTTSIAANSSNWYQTNTTSNVQVANDTRRVTSYGLPIHNYVAGWSFGGNGDHRAEQRHVVPVAVHERGQRDPLHPDVHPAQAHRGRCRGRRVSPTRRTRVSPGAPCARCSTGSRRRSRGP